MTTASETTPATPEGPEAAEVVSDAVATQRGRPAAGRPPKVASEAVPAVPAVPVTPTDSPEPRPKRTRKKPTAGNRYRLFPDNEGDYRIYQIAPEESGLPKGALLPIAKVPGFMKAQAAQKFIRDSGDQFAGMQLMILRGMEICRVDVKTVNQVKVSFKPRTPIAGPVATEAGGA